MKLKAEQSLLRPLLPLGQQQYRSRGTSVRAPERPARSMNPNSTSSATSAGVSLEEPLRPRDGHDSTRQAVAWAAVAYFLDSPGAVPDEAAEALVGDDAVVAAARHALAPVLAGASAA